MTMIKIFFYFILASVGAGIVGTTIGQFLGNSIVGNLIAVAFGAMVGWVFYYSEFKD